MIVEPTEIQYEESCRKCNARRDEPGAQFATEVADACQSCYSVWRKGCTHHGPWPEWIDYLNSEDGADDNEKFEFARRMNEESIMEPWFQAGVVVDESYEVEINRYLVGVPKANFAAMFQGLEASERNATYADLPDEGGNFYKGVLMTSETQPNVEYKVTRKFKVGSSEQRLPADCRLFENQPSETMNFLRKTELGGGEDKKWMKKTMNCTRTKEDLLKAGLSCRAAAEAKKDQEARAAAHTKALAASTPTKPNTSDKADVMTCAPVLNPMVVPTSQQGAGSLSGTSKSDNCTVADGALVKRPRLNCKTMSATRKMAQASTSPEEQRYNAVRASLPPDLFGWSFFFLCRVLDTKYCSRGQRADGRESVTHPPVGLTSTPKFIPNSSHPKNVRRKIIPNEQVVGSGYRRVSHAGAQTQCGAVWTSKWERATLG